jgi:DNA-binding FrmR family transcriptional regulator
MSLIARQNSKSLSRVRRIRGQIDAVERAIEQEIGCSELLRLIVKAHGEINGLIAAVLEDHIRTNVVDPAREPNSLRSSATDNLINIIRSCSK